MGGETPLDSFKIARNYRTFALETEGENQGIFGHDGGYESTCFQSLEEAVEESHSEQGQVWI